jgi:hypothetical protein
MRGGPDAARKATAEFLNGSAGVAPGQQGGIAGFFVDPSGL